MGDGRGPKRVAQRRNFCREATRSTVGGLPGDAPLMSSGHPANCEDVLLVSQSTRVSPLTRFCI